MPKNTWVESKGKTYVLEALEYIDGNYFKPECTAANIAERLGISPAYIDVAFKAHSDISPMKPGALIIQKRLDLAKRLMHLSPDIYSNELAEKAGFNSFNTLDNNFKKKFGVSVTKYREAVYGRKKYSSNPVSSHAKTVADNFVEAAFFLLMIRDLGADFKIPTREVFASAHGRSANGLDLAFKRVTGVSYTDFVKQYSRGTCIKLEPPDLS